jgi:rhodanese-related sulfurtransferase
MERVMPSRVPQISVTDLPADAVLLDVREDDEWAAGHAPDATHIPMGDIPARLDDVPDGSPVYVICRSGGRSARVAQFLNANGWDAVNVGGGMQSWASAGRPMVAEGDRPATVL